MERAPKELFPPLIPGTQVGGWRVEAWEGQGASGAVYRAVRVGQESAGPVALKRSLYPWGARFEREVELLSRVRHPSIPRLLDRSHARYASGNEYPFFVMEWVEGTPLYTWAEQHAPSCPEVCRLLAQLARALEALHAAGAVHRDLKGDNILVRLLDRRAFLIDFGSGHIQGAARLTWRSLPPVTPAYLSAQAWLFHLLSEHEPESYYPPSPADDLYALGVTAYRVVMGQYPPALKVSKDESGGWRVTSPDPRPLLESDPRVEPRLREVILRLLSDDPETRGTAAQVAEALEAVAAERAPECAPAEPLSAEAPPQQIAVPLSGGKVPERPSPLARRPAWTPWLALAAVGLAALILWPGQPEPASPGLELHAPDAGTASMGDTSPTTPRASPAHAPEKKPVAQEPPPEPRPGQARPDQKGRCPGRTQVPINGGCWVEIPLMGAESCAENGYVFLKGRCYTHALALPRKPLPTSSPAKAP